MERKENTMNGYVARRRGWFYAVIYEGLDPVTGRERRRWHPAGTDRAAAEQLVARLAAEEQGRVDAVRTLTFGAYLTGQWLPAKKLQLASYRGYERNVQRHILPALGRIALRRLRHSHIEALYDKLLTPSLDRPALAPKTVYEIHLVIRGCLTDAVRKGLLTRNVALLARSPRLKAIAKTEAQSWTDAQLRQFLRTAADHRLFPLLWVSAITGMRRNEVLGLKWDDIDFTKRRLGLNRGLVAIGYDVHQTRGKTRTSRRSIDLDDTTLDVLAGCGVHSSTPPFPPSASNRMTTGCSPMATATPSAHTPSPKPSNASPAMPVSPSSGSTTCATPTEASSSKKASRSRSSASGSATPTSPSPSRPTNTSCPACKPTPPASTSESPPPFHRTSPNRWNAGGTAAGTPAPSGRRRHQRRRPRVLTWAFTRHLVAGAGFEPAPPMAWYIVGTSPARNQAQTGEQGAPLPDRDWSSASTANAESPR